MSMSVAPAELFIKYVHIFYTFMILTAASYFVIMF